MEAMTFSENIVVMDQGRIVQIGKPKDPFEHPRTTFVGYFIGAPAMNMFDARIVGKNTVAIGETKFSAETVLTKIITRNVKLGIRAEFIELVPRKSKNVVKVKIQRVDDFGNYHLISA